MLPTLAEILNARSVIAGSAIRTPLVRLNVREASAEIYLKLENLQPIGSFKIRGATNAMGHLTREELGGGVLTASAGNMAQGVAWRARELGISCTVIAPESAPETKIKAIERLGGRVIQVPFNDWWRAFERRAFPGVQGTFIHAFDDLNVMAGNGTITLEILPQMLERAKKLIDGALVADLEETASALRLIAERNRVIAEGAGACPVACALKGQAGAGKVVCVVSGGNIDFAKLCTILAG